MHLEEGDFERKIGIQILHQNSEKPDFLLPRLQSKTKLDWWSAKGKVME